MSIETPPNQTTPAAIPLPARARVAPARAARGLSAGARRLPAGRVGYPARGRTGGRPLFLVRRLRPQARHAYRTQQGSGGYLRTILVGFLSSTLLLLLALLLGAGGTAWAAWSFITSDLPPISSLRVTDFQSTKIYDRKGRLIYEFSDPLLGKRTYLSIDQLPPDLINATIAAEDPTFRDNNGVDLRGIVRAVYINVSRQGTSGASTITMQLVRHVLLPEKDEASWRRKVRETILAQRLSEAYSKDKILEIYLNDIYYGAQAYGVPAAAQAYYGVAAKDLDLAQCALLAGLPQAPSEYDPHINYAEAKVRQEYVLRQMVKSGFIKPSDMAQALAEDVHPVQSAGENGPTLAPHFVNYVRALLDNLYGPDIVNRGGLRVFTTLDLDFQDLAARSASAQIEALRADGAGNAALVAINPRTGEILAMLGSVDYSNPQFGQVNVAVAPRQPGSSFKPFTYVTAFHKGYTAASLLDDIPTDFDGGRNQPPYRPKDYDLQYRGPVLVRAALANSLNIPAVQMLREVGIADVLDTAHRMGISTLNDDPSTYGLSLTLGGGDVTLLDMTSAYGTFANRGIHVPAQALLQVRDGKDHVLFDYHPDGASGVQAISPQEAYLITDVLSDNAARTPLFGAGSALKLSRPAAVKTGTTENYRDSWTLGYTPGMAVGVWVGNNDGRLMTKVAGLRGAGPIWHNFFEGTFARPELEKTLLRADETALPTAFAEPPGLVRTQVSALSGLKPGPASTDLRSELFIAGTEPSKEDDFYKLFRICIDHAEPGVAGPDYPAQFVIERPYLVLPPRYAAWTKTQKNLPLPPTAICLLPTPLPTLTPTPTISETPVPGIVGPIQIANPTALPTPILDDEFPGASAAITSPPPGSGLGGEVTITGSATATDFDYYKLEYGSGSNPATWTTINGQGISPVRSSVLGLWNTNPLPEGPYTLRLTLVGKAGQTRQYRVAVRVERTTPSVRLTTPGDGSPYYTGDTVTLTAAVSAPQGVGGVEFYVDNVRIAVAYNAPYVATWPARTGDHSLSAVAYSPTGRHAASPPVGITVADRVTPTPLPPPPFNIVFPSDGSTFTGASLPILVAAGPNAGLERVDFYLDGWKLGTVPGRATFPFSWQTIPGKHTILAIGYAPDGHEVTRTQSTVFTTVP